MMTWLGDGREKSEKRARSASFSLRLSESLDPESQAHIYAGMSQSKLPVGDRWLKRFVIHADVDAFYASVEQRDNPSLRGRAIAVGGAPNSRGVIMTASYEARRFGVGSAMPSRTAMRLCPQLVIVPPRFDAYQAASQTIMDIFRERARAIEPLSLDEAFLDISDRVEDFGHAHDHGQSIKRAIANATGLTASLGLAASKLVAKIASDWQKPDGFTAVPEAETIAFLAPLPVRRLWGVGPKTEAAMRQAGVERIGQLAEADDDWIMSHLGAWGLRWKGLARGEDDRGVESRGRAKQVSREMTFDRDIRDSQLLRGKMSDMAQSLAQSARNHGGARTVHIKIRYANFRTISRQRRAEGLLADATGITALALALLDGCWDGKPVRLIGVGLSGFPEASPDQLSLFDS